MQDNDNINVPTTGLSRRCLMAAAFFAFGLLLVTVGFWKTLLVLAITAVGALLGSRKDLRGDISSQVNRVFPPKGQKVNYDPEEIEKIKKALDLKNKPEE
ncbi:MAG: DUF2273 domain-containing protein [Clostridiales bacterium]|nr:DUF2273 domain-containing protein [Clostridiales bacterium]